MRTAGKFIAYGLFMILALALIDIAYVKSKERIYFDDSSFRVSGLLALDRYPELKERNLMFLSSGKAKTWAHKAVPRISTLLLPKKYRVYQILIAEDQYGPLTSTLFKNLSVNSQIGVLGHELAHVLDYTSKNSLEILSVGLKYYFSDDYRTVFERETNCVAMERGLRSQIFSWTDEVHEYLVDDNRGRYYHSPQEIKEGLGCK